MADKNKTYLLIGLGCIVIAFICAVVVLYFIGTQSTTRQDKMASLQAELTNLVNEKAQEQMGESDYKRARRKSGPVSVDDFVAKAEDLYGDEELARREGILWVDRKSSRYMITLGAIHDLKPGDGLKVYEEDTELGNIAVETPLDIISYIEFPEDLLSRLDKNYYRVVLSE